MSKMTQANVDVAPCDAHNDGRIIVRNLSFEATEETVKNHFLAFGEIEEVKLLKKPNGKLVGCGFVQFKTAPCAVRAIQECNAKPFLGRRIGVDWAIPHQQYAAQKTKNVEATTGNIHTPVKSDQASGGSDIENPAELKQNRPEKPKNSRAQKPKGNKKGRVIIRNLSFKATEESVKEWFQTYGEIEDVKLLKKQDGTLVGCGFVQYKTVFDAAKAIKECNAKSFLGRPIAIDWAIPKKLYAVQGTEDAGGHQETKPDATEDEEKSTVNENDGKNSDGDDDSDNDEEDEEDDNEDDEGGEINDNKDSDTKSDAWEGKRSDTERPSDVNEGKTIFIRNLDYATTQDSLKNYMEQFGSVHYALLCMDKIMERPKGTAFVKFREAESAKKCLEESWGSSLELDSRKLNVTIAITRDDLDKQKEENKKKSKDNRNLYLAREGFIRPGTQAAVGVSSTDMAKRQQNEMWKKQMLRNLHMYISRERLCVHNLPLKMTDKQLAKLFLKHSSKDAKIVEARIMRDLKGTVEGKLHPSKGFGFVTFSRHEDALLALRNLNNNPNIFTAQRRPIVEFSIENRAAVNAKIKRAQKSRENVHNGKKGAACDPPRPVVADPLADLPLPEFSGARSDSKVKGLPSHSGPKIRHRKRTGQSGHASVPSAKKPKISRKHFKNTKDRQHQTKKTAKVGRSQKATTKGIDGLAKPAAIAKQQLAIKKRAKTKWYDS